MVLLFLAAIGVPAACLLHGYVGFLFGAIKANPWWASPLMPVIFLFIAFVSGVARGLVGYRIVQGFNRRPRSGAGGGGFEGGTVVGVPEVDLVVVAQMGRVEQVLVDGIGAFVVELAMGHGSAVDFGFEQGSEHGAWR